jgi:hypothetical protein
LAIKEIRFLPVEVGLKEHSGLDNKRIGEVFGVSLSAVTKAAKRISEQRETEKRPKKETDGILYSIFKV